MITVNRNRKSTKEKDLFLNTQDTIVNLSNVSSINILHGRKRIVFNMNYQVQIKGENNKPKFISDYVYWNTNSDKEFSDNLLKLNSDDFIQREFLQKPNKDGFININEISSIKFIEPSKRVIFNLSHPVSFVDRQGNRSITSEFVYVDCKTESQYEHFKNYTLAEVGL